MLADNENMFGELGAIIVGVVIFLALSLYLLVVTMILVVLWSEKGNRRRPAADAILAAAAFIAVEVFGVLVFMELSGNSGDGRWPEWPYMAGAMFICVASIVGIVKRPTHQGTAP
jgi:protein-S-isoprenylcysteine O-methyltransferase Ste14